MINLATERLMLRSPVLDDAERIAVLAGEYDVARMIGRMPHPYRVTDAEEWISGTLPPDCKELAWVIMRDSELIGCCGLIPVPESVYEESTAILGYWTGKPYWGGGYATEAARAVLNYAFNDWNVEQILTDHFIDNPASGRVIEKLGFSFIKLVQLNCVARGNEVEARQYVMKVAAAKQQPWFRKDNERRISR